MQIKHFKDKKIVFVSCVKTKNAGLLKAEDKYNSPLFNKQLEYAKTLTEKQNIYILSAKYGLITLDTIIDDYNLTLNNFSEKEKKVWSYNVIKKAKSFNISKEDKIIFLCGVNYSKYLKKYFLNNEDPTKGLSLGNKLKWYNKKNKKD